MIREKGKNQLQSERKFRKEKFSQTLEESKGGTVGSQEEKIYRSLAVIGVSF